MFDFVRKHMRLMLGFVLLLIIPSFVFFGVEGYTRFNDPSNADAAKVDGRGISRAEWDAAHQRQAMRLRQQMPGVDASVFDTPEFRRRTLDSLVQDYTLRAAAAQQHLLPGNDRLDRLFKADPNLAGLRNPDGSVNRDLLASQGMNSENFAERLRSDYAVQQVVGGVASSDFVVASLANTGMDALLQRREVTFERFDPAAYAGKVNPGDADLEAYYKAHQQTFLSPEHAEIEYVVLDLAALEKGVTPSDEELRKFYNDNAVRFTSPEERRASHILVKADKDSPAAERDKARAKAETLLAEVRKAPGTFAEVARKQSDDTGSAGQGGDLDFFGRGSMVKPFEDAVFAMKKGDISNVVQSDFGFHIITLTDVRGGERRAFEQVRAEIDGEVRRSLAQRRYAEAAEQMSELVYQQDNSLQPVVDKLKLDRRSASVARAPAPGASGALASPKLLEAVFGTEALQNKRNTDAIEVGPSQLAAARVVKHEPQRTLPLAEVKDRVRAAVLAEQTAALARKEGEARLAVVRQGGAAELSGKAIVSRREPAGLPRKALDAVLAADLGQGPVALGVDAGVEGYVVARVLKTLPREPVPGGDAPLQAQVGQAWAAAESQAYVEALKKRYKATVKAEVVEQALRAASAP